MFGPTYLIVFNKHLRSFTAPLIVFGLAYLFNYVFFGFKDELLNGVRELGALVVIH